VTIIDRVIGGFPSGLPLVFAGSSGTGRTVLALAIAQQAVARGESVRFLTPEAAPSLLRQCQSLGFDLEAALDDGRLAILELHTEAAALVRAHGIGPLVEALHAELDGPGVVVVDPFSALVAEVADEPRLREITRSFTRAFEGQELVLTTESDRIAVQHGLDVALSEICGAQFSLTREPSGRRLLRLERTRTGMAASECVEFAIGPGGLHLVGDAEMGAAAPTPAMVGRRQVDAAVGSAVPTPPVDASERSKILVVEDDRMQREMLREWLSTIYDVVCVADGFEALASLLAEQPDLVILDLLMPRVSGYELLYSMRSAHFDVPVLVISARVSTVGERLGPLVLGATEFLSKPVARVELLHKVETLLRLPRSAAKPRFGDSHAEADALFGSFSRTRLLESAEFAERVGRACEFGRKYGLSSCLVGISSDSAAVLDRWVDAANQHLRYEDAILRVDKYVAVILLVATDPRYGPRALERLQGLEAGSDPLPAIEAEFWLAGPEHADASVIEALLDPLRRLSEAAS
jgi:DNA-binding response OmpR family regulator/KaiC/GvpD/RAD55 family RecA-like ATPase